jgi:type IV secretion system protein VirB1
LIAEAILATLIQSCAPDVGYSTMRAIVKVESGGNPWVINSNTLKRQFRYDTRQEAELAASQMVQAGHYIDMGLGQINSKNLDSLGLRVGQVFEPCVNLKAAATILKSAFSAAWSKHSALGAPTVLRHALSCYNTGDDYRGLRNGYVAKVEAAAGLRTSEFAQETVSSTRNTTYRKPETRTSVVWSRSPPFNGVSVLGTTFALD